MGLYDFLYEAFRWPGTTAIRIISDAVDEAITPYISDEGAKYLAEQKESDNSSK